MQDGDALDTCFWFFQSPIANYVCTRVEDAVPRKDALFGGCKTKIETVHPLFKYGHVWTRSEQALEILPSKGLNAGHAHSKQSLITTVRRVEF